jgi:hypothetical protein
MLAAIFAIAVQTVPPPEIRPTDLFECRIPRDATAADLVPVGLFLAGETIDYVDDSHRWEYLLDTNLQLFGFPARGPFTKETYAGADEPPPHRNYRFEALADAEPVELAFVIEQSLLGMDCQADGTSEYDCKYPAGTRRREKLSFRRSQGGPLEAGVRQTLRITCHYSLPGDDELDLVQPDHGDEETEE